MRMQIGIRRAAPVAVVPVAVLAASALLLTACSGSDSDDASASIVRSTTNVAGAGVLGNARDTTNPCGPTAPVDPAGVTGTVRTVTHAAGTTEVPADPQRIVVLDTAALDTVCALGLQDRLVGAAVPTASGTQPRYLGATVAAVEPVGTVTEPDLDRIAALDPDLILGSAPRTPDEYRSLSAIAPTTVTETAGAPWQDGVILDGTALGRGADARRLVDDYAEAATATGAALHASETQASIVRFVPGAIELYGPDSFPGRVLADVGVQRPPSQRFDGTGERSVTQISEEELSKAEGDVIYVGFSGDEAREEGIGVMNGDDWLDLGAVTDRRVFTVDDDIWMTGGGVLAAHGILDDLEASLNGYVS